ncbi:MAG: extracellular solute-binding protein [Candidatus Coproplasma sp.]
MKKFKKILSVTSACAIFALSVCSFAGCSTTNDVVTLRVCNWEEYIDLGDWGEDELIDIDNPYAENPEDGIFGENSIVDDFTEWFNSSDFGFEVNVEYSTFGTNEDLYNRLSLGDAYDLACPSDYMIMKLIAEDQILPFSEDFKNSEIDGNYYAQNVSQYIDCAEDSIFAEYDWSDYAACYMWGTTGLVYNPEKLIDDEDVSTWGILDNRDYNRQITIKDNVRDAYFAALGIVNADTLVTLSNSDEDALLRSELLNDTDTSAIESSQEILKSIKENVYSFETDSGKADMVTGKVIANFQWSGDAVYIMDEAEADASSVELWYSVPDECTNLWFDGWVMLKNGINGNEQKQVAAEAFVNFLSRPDNAVRNMYYIGYTSAIAGDVVYDYMDWTYGFVFDPSDEEYFDSELTEVYEYDLSYFFGEDYTLYVDASLLALDLDALTPTVEKLGEEYGNDIEYYVYSDAEINRGRQLFAQYPTQNVIERSVVMLDFGDKLAQINQMWINVRCLDVLDISPIVVGIVGGIVGVIVIAALLYKFRYKIFIVNKPKKGYEKVN